MFFDKNKKEPYSRINKRVCGSVSSIKIAYYYIIDRNMEGLSLHNLFYIIVCLKKAPNIFFIGDTVIQASLSTSKTAFLAFSTS